MTGQICVQGGNEFTEACRVMDAAWVRRVGPGPALVLPLACATGTEYRVAGTNGHDYLRSLGLPDVAVAPEPGVQLDRVVHAIVTARTVVIPGGSPARIHRRVVGTALGAALRAHIAGGGALVGASAGAMVLASWMILPGQDDDVHPGLGLVPDVLVLPHFRMDVNGDGSVGAVTRVRRGLPDDVDVLGLPECSGVLYDGRDHPMGLGVADSWSCASDTGCTTVPRA